MLAKSLSFLAGADAAGIVLGARVPIILTSRADSVMTRLASCAVAALVAQSAPRSGAARRWPERNGRRDRRTECRLVEHQVLAVRRSATSDLALVARGQAEGLYTSPRFVAKDGAGAILDEKSLGRGRRARPRRRARPPGRLPAQRARASTGSSAWAIASCTAGSSTRSRCASMRRCSRRWKSTCRSRRCTSRTTWRRSARCSSALPQLPQVACFDTAFHRAQPPVAQAFALPKSITERGVRPLRLPRPVVRVHRAGVCRSTMRGPRAGKVVVLHLGNGASMCAIAGGRSIASTMGFTAADGLPMGTRCGNLDPGVVLYLMDELEDGCARDREADLPAVGPARRVGHFERHAHARGERRARRARPRSTSTSTASAASSARSPPRSAGSTRSCSPPASARTAASLRERVCRDAAWLGVELDAGRQRGAAARASAPPASRVSAWVIPTNEELMIARHTRSVL